MATKISHNHVNAPGLSPELDDDDLYVTISSLRRVAPEGWTMYTHPRGSIYFRHSRFRVVVDEDIRIPAQLEKATDFGLKHSRVDIPEDLEAYMAYGMDVAVCLYVNHKQCVAGYELSKLVNSSSIRDLSVDALLRARRLYWNFIAHHPSHEPCPRQGHLEAIDALHSYHHGHLIDGSRSIGPFSKEECEQLIDMLHRERDSARDLPAVVSLVGWVLRDVYSFRTGQRYGQITWDEMRKYRKALYQPQDFTRRESLLTKFFLTLCIHGPFFGIPQTYLAHIKKASEFRGHIAGLRTSWESYTRQLVREYSDFILIATVLLSATVGILTINDVGEIARVAAMLSAFASLGSITVGVFFVWRHQRNIQMPSSFTYLHNARNNAFGLSGHAIILSLPPVLLVWSIIGFAASILAYALQQVSEIGSPSSWLALAIFIVVFTCVMIGVYTFSTIWRWQSQDPWWRNVLCWPEGGDNGPGAT
ncbi:hypothetical protein C8Q80DRAFT_1154703 [Daedaleopsis nitida]|nr:hypothetical protein C8Q80DRAFT_1154703 [Daedaleopsis nitida]